MAETLHEELDRNIPLSEMIQSLRMELKAAMHAARGDDLQLTVKEAEIELHVAVGREKEGGLKLWVVEAGRKATDLTTHVFRLKLAPELETKDERTGEVRTGEVRVSQETSRKPR